MPSGVVDRIAVKALRQRHGRGARLDVALAAAALAGLALFALLANEDDLKRIYARLAERLDEATAEAAAEAVVKRRRRREGNELRPASGQGRPRAS